MTRNGNGRPPRGRSFLRARIPVALLALALALTACSSGSSEDRTEPVRRSPAGPTWAPSTPAIGAYMGRHSSDIFRSTFGRYPDVETNYFDSDRVTTPDVAEARRQIEEGTSPVITLGFRNGRFTRAEIADWGPAVQDYFRTFVGALRDLSEYAEQQGNGTRVYFADEHEAVVKINQAKYTFSGYDGGQPTVGDSARAWNRVMGYVRDAAPKVVRTYWYGGSGDNEDVFASALQPDLIQLATMDIYHWYHDPDTATPEQLWGAKVEKLAQQPWMQDGRGGLKPWAVTEWGTDASHGDADNTAFVTEALRFFAEHGASFSVYFYRVDNNDNRNDFVFSPQDQAGTFRAFDSAVTG